jgi:hypothetical protein
VGLSELTLRVNKYPIFILPYFDRRIVADKKAHVNGWKTAQVRHSRKHSCSLMQNATSGCRLIFSWALVLFTALRVLVRFSLTVNNWRVEDLLITTAP